MTNDLLVLINKKNDMYRNWKSTVNDEEYENKKVNFKTYDRIVSDGIQNAKHQYYFNTFISHKNNMKKTWKTIDETLNRGKNKTNFPSEFIVDQKIIADHKEIADNFNVFFANIGAKLSAGNKAIVLNHILITSTIRHHTGLHFQPLTSRIFCPLSTN